MVRCLCSDCLIMLRAGGAAPPASGTPGASLALTASPRTAGEAGAGVGLSIAEPTSHPQPQEAGDQLGAVGISSARAVRWHRCTPWHGGCCPLSHCGGSFSTPGVQQTALPVPEPTSSCCPSPQGEQPSSGGIPGAGAGTPGWGEQGEQGWMPAQLSTGAAKLFCGLALQKPGEVSQQHQQSLGSPGGCGAC